MTGRELIEWIQAHKAEDYEIVVIRDGIEDFLRFGIDEPDEENKQIVI